MGEGPKNQGSQEQAQPIGPTGKSQDLTANLKNADPVERARAARALGESQDHDGAVRALETVLRNDPDREVRAFAAKSLGQLGGPAAIALLVEKMTSTDEAYVRGAALFAIKTSGDPSAIEGLINVIRRNTGDHDVAAQNQASQTLVAIGAPGVPQLLQALNDSSAKVRKAVVEVLGEMGNPEVFGQIAGLQADPDPGVRQAVEVALVKLKTVKR